MGASRFHRLRRNNRFIIERNGQAVAVTGPDIYDDSPDGNLALLYVLPTARRRGIGKTFLRALAHRFPRLDGEFYGLDRYEFYSKAGCAVSAAQDRGRGRFYLYPLKQQPIEPALATIWTR